MIDRKQLAVLVLLDFSKAFDVVCHSTLLYKLSSQFNFSNTAVRLISSYLRERSQFVENDGCVSNPLPVNSGVPQGSILGPLLFTLYINELPSILRYCKCVMYADDVQVYYGGIPSSNVTACVNDDLSRVSSWAAENNLTLNVGKTCSMLFTNTNYDHYISVLPTVQLNGYSVPFSTSFRNLGIVMDNKLSWENNVNHICGGIYGKLRALWTTASFTSLNLRIKLVKALLLPHLMYCSSVMGRLSVGNFMKLKKSYYACLRYIYNKSRFESVSHLSTSVIGCSLSTFLKYRMCLSLHKLIKNHEPTLLYNRLLFGFSLRTGNLRVPNHRTTIRNNSFFVYSIVTYNKLPLDIRNLPFNKFKDKSFQYMRESSTFE